MKAVVLTSNGLRHQYFAQTMAQGFDVVGVIAEPKKGYYVDQIEESAMIRQHFANLKATEERFFGDANYPECDLWMLEKSRINDADVVEWAIDRTPDVILLFGTAILKEGWLTAFHDLIINLHLGLSPFYRGSATLFWPICNGEVECIGATVHLATDRVDGGDIIGRIKPDLAVGDDYYEINYKAIRKAIDRMPSLIQGYLSGRSQTTKQNLSDSKLYRKGDFDESALRQALEHLSDGLTHEQIKQIESSSRCVC